MEKYRGYYLEVGPESVAVYWIPEPNLLVAEFPTLAAAKAAVDEWLNAK